MTHLPYPQNITGLGDLFVYSNTVTGHTFGSLISIVFFLVVFISLKNYTGDRAFTVAALGAFVISTLLGLMGTVNTLIPVTFLMLTIVGILWNWISG